MMDIRDTTVEAQAFQDEIHRRMGPVRRFELAWELSLMARESTLAGIRRDHPDYTEGEAMREYVRTRLLSDIRLPEL
jgi:hypothetical protein